MNGRLRLEPQAPHLVAARLSRVHFDFPARDRPVAILGADRRRLHADRPDLPFAAKQPAQSVHGREEVAAVLLHHRQQEVAAGVAPKPRVMFQGREPRQQHAARLALVPRERERAFQDVAGREHAQLVAQLTRASAAVEHRDDGVEMKPGIVLETAEEAGEPRAAAETADVQLAELHSGHSSHLQRPRPMIHPLSCRRSATSAPR